MDREFKKISRAGQLLHYCTVGQGEPLLLIHSFLCSMQMWEHQIDELSREFQVIAIDIRGHGQSGPAQPHDLYDLVEDAIAILDAERVESAFWCGLSIGGMISMRAAIKYRHRVRGLVLFNTDGGAEHSGIIFKHTILAFIVKTLGVKFVSKPVLELMFGVTARETQPELIERWKGRILKVHVPSMIETLKALKERKDVKPKLEELDIPALVVHGTQDKALSLRRGKALAETLSAEFIVLESTGHLSALERPQQVLDAMVAFLRAQV